MQDIQYILKAVKKDPEIKSFIKDNNIPESVVENNLVTLCSLLAKKKKCEGCPGLDDCRQTIKGQHPVLAQNDCGIYLDYEACDYQKKADDEMNKIRNLRLVATSFQNFDLSNVYQNEQRTKILNRITQIYIDYLAGKKVKGIYIHGPYGTGKTYIMAWLAKTLADKGTEVVFAYYPDLVRQIKSAISSGDLEDILMDIKEAPVLFLDDIGGESNSDFVRDEVLGAILQERMTKNLLTFMSSNLSPDNLREHLATGNKEVDVLKGARIFERIRTLMDFVELKDKNYRN